MREFEFAAGSVVGRDHLRAARNGHDAFHIETTDEALVAVVCDGCGSAPDSEIGAKVGAPIIARALAVCHSDWKAATREIDARLKAAIAATVRPEAFLFTIIAAVVTAEETTILARGDGSFLINGAPTTLGPFPGNAPPYFFYEPRLDVIETLPTGRIGNIVLGTDGMPAGESWIADRYFTNPDAIRRALFRMQPNDDATVVAIRRRA